MTVYLPRGASVLLLFCCLTGVFAADTLYSFDEPIVQLHTDNFTDFVVGSGHVWVVEFYATWCGHCQRFAPLWKALARDVKGWSGVIKVAAVACSDPANSITCRNLGIWGYPSIRFFPPGATEDHRGYDYRGRKELLKIRNTMIDFIETVRDKPTGWPSLQTLRSLNTIWENATASLQYAFIVFEDPVLEEYRYLGREVILDWSTRDDVGVYRMSRDSMTRADLMLVNRHDIDMPSVAAFERRGLPQMLLEANTHQALTKVMEEYIENRTHTTTEAFTTLKTPYPEPEPNEDSTEAPVQDGLHMQDLESAIYYSLWVEVGVKKTIRVAAMRALKEYIAVLARYHPGKSYISNFLNKTSRWLRNKYRLSGQEWLNKITKIQNKRAYVPSRVAWVGCQGSETRYRGYPCSLWMTFHALTVSHLEDWNHPYFDPREILIVMKNYIHHFFGCRACADHFGNMVATIDEDIHLPQDGVIWLWKAHNLVNQRLKGEYTEDPEHPKIQWPSHSTCPNCQEGWRLTMQGDQNVTYWNNYHVLEYVRRYYGRHHIIDDALPFNFKKELPV